MEQLQQQFVKLMVERNRFTSLPLIIGGQKD
jgi:hypothetical protein